jgi:hypothetical protein
MSKRSGRRRDEGAAARGARIEERDHGQGAVTNG